MRNNNQAIVRKITRKSLKSNIKRNFFIITAIMLTTFMISSVIGIGISYKESMDNYIGLQEEQYGDNYSVVYTLGDPDSIETIAVYTIIIIFLMFVGYLLIYNVMHISITNDVRFYGLLKTVGTTPRQIYKIVTGQVLRLCIVAIPLGLLLTVLLSNVIIPMIVLVETGVIISFSPFIYIGAAFFALVTALIGAASPVKKASDISAVEAVKYSGEHGKISRFKKSANGKPHKMAVRNIFRDKKRAVVVFLNLFLSLNLFLVITTIVSSMDADKYADSYLDGDFLLRRDSSWGETETNVFDDKFLKEIMMIPGFENMQINTKETVLFTYSDGYNKYLEAKTNGNTAMTEYSKGNFQGHLGGIDKSAIEELNRSLPNPIDAEAFERGEFALIATDSPDLFSSLETIEIQFSSGETFIILLGGFVPDSYKWIYEYTAPTVFVSNTFLKQFIESPSIDSLDIYVDSKNASQALTALQDMTSENKNLMLISRIEERQAVENAKMILSVLGGAVSIILGLIGVMNFINVMSVGILSRKREIAAMESIGMSRKQTRSMLIYEGVGYALITLLSVLTIGNAVAVVMYNLFEDAIQQGSYSMFSFSYPLASVVIMCLTILVICVITPAMIYRSINRITIVERLREAE